MVAVAGAPLAVPKPAAAGSTPFSVFQHNVLRSHYGSIKYVVEHDPPLIVTAQELCLDGLRELEGLLEGHGYSVDYHVGYPSLRTCDGPGLISMVATRGVFGDSFWQDYPAQVERGVYRGFVCIQASAYLLSWWACSTHITAATGAAAVSQSDYLRDVAFVLNDRPVIVAGDFNRTPNQTGPAGWRQSFVEVDQRANRPTYDNDPGDPLTKKIDFIFSMRLRTDVAGSGPRLGCGRLQTNSDHCFLHGRLRFIH